MKFYTKFLFILVFVSQLNIFPQIPNAGFENWIDVNTPQDWTPNNVPTLWTTVTKSNTAHTGSFAALLQTANASGTALPPFLQSVQFPLGQVYGSLSGYYQFQPATASEVLNITAWLTGNGTLIGFGSIDIGIAASGYTQFNFDIETFGDAALAPDSGYIWVAIYDTSENDPVVGATALIDDFSFGPSSSVKQINSELPENFGLTQNYPNPFNPTTKINFSIPEQSHVDLTIYDILGNEITKLINNSYSAGEYAVDFNSENLPAGIYVARLSAGKYSKAIKMTLLK